MITTQMTDITTRSLHLLRDGFKRDFANCVYCDERFTDLLQELSLDFVQSNIPVIDEDNQMELALMMMETINITAG